MLLACLSNVQGFPMGNGRGSPPRGRGVASGSRRGANRGTHDDELWDQFKSPRRDGGRPRDEGRPRQPEAKVWHAEAARGQSVDFYASSTFADLGASEDIITSLQHAGAERPSQTQALGFRPILSGQDVVLADRTGSGKTLAYLAPLVQRLRIMESEHGRTPPGGVRALVLVPTSELAQQVLSVAKTLAARGAPFRSAIITGEHKWATQKCTMAARTEVLCWFWQLAASHKSLATNVHSEPQHAHPQQYQLPSFQSTSVQFPFAAGRVPSGGLS